MPLERDGIHTGVFHMSTESSFTSGQLSKFIEVFGDKGVITKGFQQGFSQGIFSDVAEFLGAKSIPQIDRERLRKVLGLNPKVVNLRIDGSETLEEMIADNSVETDTRRIIPEQWTVTANEIVDVVAEIIGLIVREDSALLKGESCLTLFLAELGKRGYRPAMLKELLAFVPLYRARFPNKRMIVALGAKTAYNEQVAFASIYEPESKPGTIVLMSQTLQEVLDFRRDCLFIRIR